MRIRMLAFLLLLLALLLSSCRFVVVESGSVHVEAPTPPPGITLGDLP